MTSRSPAPWQGRLKDLFDDSVDPSAVGLAGTSASNAGGVIQARAEEAHFVVRVRATTVTTAGSGRDLRYLVTLRVIGDPIVGPSPPTDTIHITIGQDNPSFGVVKAKDLGLAGTRFIAFLREFKQGDASVLHWHLARDGRDVVDAVEQGAVLSEFTGG